MSYGNVFKFLKENNKENWLLYTKHDFISKLSNDTLKKEREALYLECVPFLEKLIGINKNKEAVKTLMNIYGVIGDNLGYQKMKKMLE